MSTLEDNLESDLKKNKVIAERGKALQRLLKSTDFNSVILSGFLREYALQLVYERADSTEVDDAVSRKIDGIALFKQYLDKVLTDAAIADKDIGEISEQLLELRNED